MAALQASAQDSGLSPAAAGLIAGGGFDLIQVRIQTGMPLQQAAGGAALTGGLRVPRCTRSCSIIA